mgnify:CR=1 FL=1
MTSAASDAYTEQDTYIMGSTNESTMLGLTHDELVGKGPLDLPYEKEENAVIFYEHAMIAAQGKSWTGLEKSHLKHLGETWVSDSLTHLRVI